MGGIRLWSWLKVRYESSAKLDPLRRLYRDNIWSLKLKASGLLVYYINRFQGLEILWREIDKSVEPKYHLVTQMVEHIEDMTFSGTYKITKN